MKRINLGSAISGFSGKERLSFYRKIWFEAGEYQVLTDYPLHLDIELAGVCNLKCGSCFQDGLIKEKLGFMEFDLFKKIIDEGKEKGLCAVKLQVRGESFLHPKLFDCICYAKEAGVMDIQITTNGTILDDKRIQNIFDSCLDGIIFTVDARHMDSYNKKIKTQSYSTIEDAINNFLYLRDKLGKSRPWIRVQASVIEDNTDNIRRAEIDLKRKFPMADVVIVFMVHDFREDTEAYTNLHENYNMLHCNYLMQRLAVFWNGDVTTCCFDYNSMFKLGNIKQQTIEEIWNSEKLENLRVHHNNGLRKDITICRNCTVNIVPISGKEADNKKSLNYIDNEFAEKTSCKKYLNETL